MPSSSLPFPVQSLWLLVSSFWLFTGTGSVFLHKVDVPRSILNGSLDYIILDCQYSLNHSERDGMVLKWYLDGKTIYQWIPPARPQGLGLLRGKINLDYEVSPAPFTRHRALYLNHPTTEMTGEYTCKVSTMQNEVSRAQKMVVYEPPRQIQLMHRKSFLHHVNVTCFVDQAFPEPTVELYVTHGGTRVRLKDTEERFARYPNGGWQKVVYIVLSDSMLRMENVFDCDVKIPGTKFASRKRTVYYSDHPTIMASASAASNSPREKYHLDGSFWTIVYLLAKAVHSS